MTTTKGRRSTKSFVPLALSSLLLAGCVRQAEDPIEAFVAIDVSCPSPKRLLGYAATAYEIQRSLPRGSRLRVYVFGHGSSLVYTGERLTGRDAFNAKVGRYLGKPPVALLASGTRTDLLLEQVAADVKRSTGKALVLIATDGGMEDGGSDAMDRISRAVASFAGRKDSLRLCLIGVKPEFRSVWEERLSPVGLKATVRGDLDVESFPWQEVQQ
ncbi:MAG: hypothetical protein HZC36_14685 [Armatimonadetes bacterium]|nr:hypothetical protein [Armatimonadota bacterium]